MSFARCDQVEEVELLFAELPIAFSEDCNSFLTANLNELILVMNSRAISISDLQQLLVVYRNLKKVRIARPII